MRTLSLRNSKLRVLTKVIIGQGWLDFGIAVEAQHHMALHVTFSTFVCVFVAILTTNTVLRYTVLSDWSLLWTQNVFTVRYELNFIK